MARPAGGPLRVWGVRDLLIGPRIGPFEADSPPGYDTCVVARGSGDGEPMDWQLYELYAIIVAGIILWLTLVFQVLMGLRIVKLKGPLHWRVHRWVAYFMIVWGLLHGTAAVGHLVFGWF